LRGPTFGGKTPQKTTGAKVSIVTEDEIAIDHAGAARSGRFLPGVLCVLLAATTAAFLWAFALPMIGLAVFVSKFFAG
jgi:hypothetical protein